MNRSRPYPSRLPAGRRLARGAAALATCLVAGAGLPGAAGASDWKWTVAPYVWATDVGVDVEIADRQVVDEVIAVEELMEDVETIAQVRVEAQKGAHGLFVDLFDVTLADETTGLRLPQGAGTAAIDADMGMTIAELGGFYDPNGAQQGFQILYGARLLNERAEVDATFALANGATVARDYELDDTFVDALAGVRYVRRFSSRWMLEAKADVSAGGTELTWSAGPTVGYTFGEAGRYTLTGGYRQMVVEFETDEPVEAEMTLSGLLVGLRVAF
jgi:hypothetical protein